MGFSNAISLGGGGFGSVYHTENHPDVAIKVVKFAQLEGTLSREYEIINATYQYMSSQRADQLFKIPRPLDLFDPTTGQCRQSTFAGAPEAPNYFDELAAATRCYSMDRIPAIAGALSQLLYTKLQPTSQSSTPIQMCRLYFGKESRKSRFFNTRNCPVDRTTYEWLHDAAKEHGITMPTAGEVAYGMGQMFATVALSGYDVNDMEFVLAGNTSENCGFYAFDFDKMHSLSAEPTLKDKVESLKASYWRNDPYFPRKGDVLFEEFGNGIKKFMDEEGMGASARLFLDTL